MAKLSVEERKALGIAVRQVGAVTVKLAEVAEMLFDTGEELWNSEETMEAASVFETLADRLAAESRRYGELLRLLERRGRGSLSWSLLEEVGLPSPGRKREG